MDQSIDAFISYAHDDRARVTDLVGALERDGFRVWIDTRDAPAGIAVPVLIADAMTRCRHTIVCLSDHYISKEWTTHELIQSVYRDATSLAAGTIPVIVAPFTLELPGYIRPLSRLDFSDPDRYPGEYQRLVRQLRAGRAAAPAPAEPADVEHAAELAFAHREDPMLTLFYIRRATVGLAKLLHVRYLGPLPADVGLDRLIDLVLLSGKAPPEGSAPLALLHTFCRQAVTDRVDDPLSRETVAAAVDALEALTDWVFPGRRRRRTLAAIWDHLPRGDTLGERLIPGTGYRLRTPQLGRNSLGPVYAGVDTARQEAVAVNLVTVPPDAEDRFFEEAARFRRLSAANVISPRDAGRVVVDGEPLCLYLVLPALDGIDARQLLERNGPLPARAAAELALGVATALAGFHGADPPVVHGDITPANVFVSRFGTVGVLCVGRSGTPPAAGDPDDPGGLAGWAGPGGAAPGPAHDLAALRTLFTGLLAGDDAGAAGWAERLAGCRTAHDACRVLRAAARPGDAGPETAGAPGAPGAPGPAGPAGSESLAAVVRRHLPEPGGGGTRLRLRDAAPIAARAAWPLGGDAVLVWERGTDTLAVFRDGELDWRDDTPVRVRRTTTGSGGRFAVGGWDGAVRCFTGGRLTARTRLDGAVGDLAHTADSLIAGSWNRALCRITADGGVHRLLAVDRGVHRIAVSDRADRFTVADQSGGLAAYAGDQRVEVLAAAGPIRDIAYAGNRLVVLGEETVGGVRLDGSRTGPVPSPGGFALRPLAGTGRCLLLAVSGRGDGGTAVQGWRIDEGERRLAAFTLPPGERLLSVTPSGDRLTVFRPGGGCAYRRGDAEVHVWPEALAASVSEDGRTVAVVRPDRVELYEDPA